ncbi:MAG: hypothetical protein OEV27_15920 [Nitrospira sp.]|nr:hypothetical protein [Nitrospira sp.]MDH4252666.1 hypothetical protein [Nitrospira sp.]MDH4344534.1 hypothetical protein [Nitrospira sp.]MDH5337858.1 hypothetical protein [Nitrospira sp.]
MTRSNMSRLWLSVAGLVILVYATLLVMAMGCVLAHADRSQSHQHHHDDQGSSTQTLLCAWACQATTDTVVAVGLPSAVVGTIIGLTDLIPSQLVLSMLSSAIRSRAPPLIAIS